MTAVAAVLVRIWFPRAWGELHAPASVFYQGDARAYLDYAASLVRGVPFDNGVPFHPPGWPFVLSLFYRAAGFDPIAGRPADMAAVKAFVAILSGITVGLTALLADRMCGRGAMLAVAAIGTFSFAHIVQGSVPNADALYGLLVAGCMLLAWRWYAEPESPKLAVTLGALAGFATLVRPEFALCAALLAIPRPRQLGWYAVAFAIVLTPTTIWHWQSISAFNASRAGRMPGPLPRFAPVTSYGAFNFANANHGQSPGGFNFDAPALKPQTAEEERQFDEGYLDLSLPSVYDVYVNGYSIGLKWMAGHPGEALALIGRKAMITSGVFAHGYLQANLGAGVDGTRRPVDQIDPSSRRLWTIHLALTMLGLWLLVRGSAPSRRWTVLCPLASLAASSLLFFGYVRLGAAYLPAFWILQGMAIAWIASRLPLPETVRAKRVALVAGMAVLLLVVEASGLASRRRVVLEGATAEDGSIIQDATVRIRSR